MLLKYAYILMVFLNEKSGWVCFILCCC